jgi:hypothetical protein
MNFVDFWEFLKICISWEITQSSDQIILPCLRLHKWDPLILFVVPLSFRPIGGQLLSWVDSYETFSSFCISQIKSSLVIVFYCIFIYIYREPACIWRNIYFIIYVDAAVNKTCHQYWHLTYIAQAVRVDSNSKFSSTKAIAFKWYGVIIFNLNIGKISFRFVKCWNLFCWLSRKFKKRSLQPESTNLTNLLFSCSPGQREINSLDTETIFSRPRIFPRHVVIL